MKNTNIPTIHTNFDRQEIVYLPIFLLQIEIFQFFQNFRRESSPFPLAQPLSPLLHLISPLAILLPSYHAISIASSPPPSSSPHSQGPRLCNDGTSLSGIRMLDQPYMTDLIEANSMGHEPHLIDIYSASWGPTDDGKTVDGPRNATMRAIVRGVNEGRNGLGNIYVWASGDGGEDDDCNCDGYAASMWTVSINSAINDGQNAHYDESCSSTLASTFSNGAKDPNTGVGGGHTRLWSSFSLLNHGISRNHAPHRIRATTDLYGKCTTTHSGTSAAAPEAAGVFALALEANTQLTWRDIQHLTVLTSKRNSLFDAKGRFHWTMNGVGLEFNHLFGFGVLDAGAMVALSKQWRTVPARYHCEGGSVKEAM
ncbi:hypothetical protein FOCC_FOCC017213 [Frankliniella occidentalis]|nr:hypothetical protein FOCC_FOCC017213 [Frankliniella occidentalis]